MAATRYCLFAQQAVIEGYNIDRPLIRQEIVLKQRSVQVILNFSNYPRVLRLFPLRIRTRRVVNSSFTRGTSS